MISYFLGMAFYIFADLTNDIESVANVMDGSVPMNFLQYYDIEHKNS